VPAASPDESPDASSLRDGFDSAVIDMHIHSRGASSDSMLDPDELPALAAAGGLTGFNISEHDQVWERHRQAEYRAEHPRLFANFAMEVSTDLGHMLAIGLEAYESGIHRADRLRAAVDRVGGFLIVAHPFRHVFDPVTAMRTGGKPFDLTPEQAAELPVFRMVDAIEVANACNTPRENYFASEVAAIAGLPGTGGSDAHSDSGIGYFATGFERPVSDAETLVAELRAGRFHAVHRTTGGRVVRFGPGSIEDAQGADTASS
jgi:predicted metal-dependent phosphoesterase TrpH